MNRTLTALLALLLLGAASLAAAQRTTERFIPIGQSPGVSGKVTVIGTLEAVDAGSLAVQSSTGTQRIKLTDATRIWLDRSAMQQSALTATAAELRPGRRVEVKFADEEGRTTAEWIKIEAATR